MPAPKARTPDVELELDVLSRALKDRDYMRQAAPTVKRHFFTEKSYGWFWDKLYEWFRSTREIPTPSLWLDWIDDEFADPTQNALMVDVARQLFSRKPAVPKIALNEIRSFVRTGFVRVGITDALDGMDDGSLDQAEAALGAAYREAKSVATESEERVPWAASYTERLAKYMSPSTGLRFQTFLPSVDRATNGGIPAGSTVLLMAYLNVGKSTSAVDFGFRALTANKAVVIHLGDEETYDQLAARYDARMTGIDRGRLLSGKCTPAERKLFEDRFARRMVEIGDRLQLHEISPGADIGFVETLVEQAREQYPTSPIALVVDSPDHMRPPKKRNASWEELGDLAWEFKRIAKTKVYQPMYALLTTQAGRQSDGRMPKAKDVAGAIAKMQAPDLGLSLCESTDESPIVGKKLFEIMIIRNRLSMVKGLTVYATVDTGTCEFEEALVTSATT